MGTQDATQPEERFDLRGRTLRQHAARGTLINAAFLVALSSLGFFKGFLLAGLLNPDDYGVWGILLIGLGTLAWLKQVGISDRYIQQDEADQELAFQKAFTLEAMFNAAIGALIIAAIPLLAVVYGEPRIVAPGIALVLILPALTLQAPLWILYRRMEFAKQRTLQSVDPIVSLIASVGLALAGAGYWSFVLGALAGSWATALVAVRASPYPLRWRYDAGTARGYVRFSGPLLISSLGGIVVAQGSILAGMAYGGLLATGAITLASTISQFTNRVDDVVTDTLYPAICAVADQTEKLYETFVKSNRLALMWALPFGFGVALFASDLVTFVIGEKWRPAVEPIQAFGVGAALGHLGFNWIAFFMARGDTRPIAVWSLASAAAFLAVELPLILTMGLDGLAIGTLVLVGVGLAVRAFYLRRLFAGFSLAVHALRAVAPALPPVAAILVWRAASGGDRSESGAIAELIAYVVLAAACTAVAERALLREVVALVRSRSSVVD